MEFRILGQLDVVEEGTPLALGAYKQRALLAVLLLSRGEAVSVDRLVDAIWGDEPPASAAKSIQVYISHLRKTLGETLETRGRGYLLRVGPEQLDAARFEVMLGQGRELLASGRAREAERTLREALALWRGPALADFAYEPFAQAEIARLDELRMSAIEERIEAELALARHTSLVGELERLVRDHPLRERLHGQLMLALYGCGRQGDALEAYRRAREVLVDELGVEPGPSLRDVHAAILRQDPDLTTSSRAAARSLARRRGGALVALGGAVLAAAAAGAAALTLTDGDDLPSIGPVRPLPATFCSPLQYASGAEPRLLVVSDQELRGAISGLGNEIAATVEFVLRENGFRAGRHELAYQACDSSMREGTGDSGCVRNAEAYVANPAVIGIVGPTVSQCAVEQIPIANTAPGGPVAMVSASNTHVGLTRRGAGAEPHEPDGHYPTGLRNYVRLMPADDLQAAANVMLAEQLGVERVFILKHDYGVPIVAAFRRASERLGLDIVGEAHWQTGDYVLDSVRKSRPDAIFLSGTIAVHGVGLLSDLRRDLGPDVHIMATDGFSLPDELRDAGRSAEGMTISVSGIAPEALEGPGRQLMASLEAELGGPPHQFALYAAQATELLLDAIERSDGTRPSVVRELLSTRLRGGILGDFAVTATGDTTATQVTIYRVRSGRMEVDRILRPPINLIAGQ